MFHATETGQISLLSSFGAPVSRRLSAPSSGTRMWTSRTSVVREAPVAIPQIWIGIKLRRNVLVNPMTRVVVRQDRHSLPFGSVPRMMKATPARSGPRNPLVLI